MQVRTIVFASVGLVLSADLAMADACRDKFVAAMTRQDTQPVRIELTQKFGNSESRTIHSSAGVGHWMTESVSPPNTPWTLVYANVMYTSPDKGKTWKKVRDVDSAANQKNAAKNARNNAANVTNTRCGREAIGGVQYDTVAGEYKSAQPNFKADVKAKYWVEARTGFIVKAEVVSKLASGVRFDVTQTISRAPGLKLPKP